ncbi:hypothetical protein [Paracoccus sediminicola]|uniref:hypothetical protein n=1 Tax=Paracoccus sediminicola TaxID=3017783 RepID=UPI0022F1078E|nr:hypothetical protein [Paracoccus sediminicola]WBU55447.1 hypothetical protein PAF18_07855 [Paracoccus sediminicola]
MNETRKSDKTRPESREDRLGKALRANLARRKAQARARADHKEGGQAENSAPESEE